MLSYDSNSQETVSNICYQLRIEHIPLWVNEQKETMTNLKKNLAEGVENAAVVCCFMTPDYQNSSFCQIELQYAQKRQKRIIPCMLTDSKVWEPSDWLELITRDLVSIDVQNVSEPSTMRRKVGELINQIEDQQPPAPQYLLPQRADQPIYLFELIKYEYKQNSRIERFINPKKSFPIELSYINLTIIETKEQQEKEKKLRDTQHSDTIISVFENIHGNKTPTIDVKDIFKTCKDQTRNVLVPGRAGIGKSTFCRYVAYQWATGTLWTEYDLVVSIPLRSLTKQRYPALPAGISYSLIDVLKIEYFSFDQSLSVKDEKILQELFRNSRILWLLDGYDEIVQNIPEHLECLMERLLKTPHHIVTSRPYMNTLSYDACMEITGFTDKNIHKYVKQFFDQIGSEAQNSSPEDEKILNFLKRNPHIWGISHIPINLELICSVWSNTNWSEKTVMTMTVLYDTLVEWVCRRYLENQKRTPPKVIDLMDKTEVYDMCNKELAFLESLAFLGMESNAIILDSTLLKQAKTESKCSFVDYPHLLNIGILKSIPHHHGTGTRNETEKDHSFVHLSFQEYFAARYVVTALNRSESHKIIDFIKDHKYNRRFGLMLSFASGRLANTNNTKCIDIFWDTILGKPLDMVGIRHMEIVISCMEEAHHKEYFKQYDEIMTYIIKCVDYAVHSDHSEIGNYLNNSLHRSPTIVNENKLAATFTTLLQTNNATTKQKIISLISGLPIFKKQQQFIQLLVTALGDANDDVRATACGALGLMGEKAATKDVIAAMVTALEDANHGVRAGACGALGMMGEKAATKDVIAALVSALKDANDGVRARACDALGMMGEKAATKDVTAALVTAVGDANHGVTMYASRALDRIGKKAATKDVIAALVNAMANASNVVRWWACHAVVRMGEKAATKDVITALLTALEDANHGVRAWACEALSLMGEKAATKDVIEALLTTLEDASLGVVERACEALARIGKKAATKDVIAALVNAMANASNVVRWWACHAVARIGEKAATKNVIEALLTALEDANHGVRAWVCEALGLMGEKAATKDVIAALLTTLEDANHGVRAGACGALGMMGEKAATKDVIAALVTAVEDANDDVRARACGTLGMMGEKSATNEVIAPLVIALEDAYYTVRLQACQTLGRIGEKAATKDVIAALVTAVEDASNVVRWWACHAVVRIGEEAATKDVIEALLTALEDANHGVRAWVCEALGLMGEKAATKDVIAALLTTLEDANHGVRAGACGALGMMGEKAATKDVIAALLTTLEDANHGVRAGACEALGLMGEKAATKDVIAALLTTLEDANHGVRAGACGALGMMGEKAATKDVIAALVTAVEDANDDVRARACGTLGMMDEKSATNEVITPLVIALEDAYYTVRLQACQTLGRIGEKAATKDVIAALVNAMANASNVVRASACEGFGRMVEKAATKDVIEALVTAVEDANDDVRASACEGFGRMVEKAATKDVIEALLTALEDANHGVKAWACEALSLMGEKAATTDVIAALVTAVEDANDDVRGRACHALARMGEKAATNSVINGLLTVASQDGDYVLGQILVSAASLSFIDSSTVSKLFEFWDRNAWRVRDIPLEKIMKAYSDMEIVHWCSIIGLHSFRTGCAVSIVDQKIILYGKSDPVQFDKPSGTLCDELVRVFANQKGLAFYLDDGRGIREDQSTREDTDWVVV